MKIQYTKQQFDNADSETLLSLKCEFCGSSFLVSKRRIRLALNPNHHAKCRFCSKKCHSASNITKVEVVCKNCNIVFLKRPCQIRKTPNHFCSRSCAAIYNNANKKRGTRRSKLEAWIEEQLTILYPELEIHFNRKDAINSELDIYIPSISLAIELNGIFHYEPIYGEDKLSKTQNNDDRKFQACLERNIEFCIIDTSSQIYFTSKTSQRYLGIICSVIDKKLMTLNT